VRPSWARSCVRGWMASKPHDMRLLARENFIQFSHCKIFTLYNMYNYLTSTSHHIFSSSSLNSLVIKQTIPQLSLGVQKWLTTTQCNSSIMIHTTIVIPQIISHNFTTVVLHGKYLRNINYIQSTILCTISIHFIHSILHYVCH
jgi:hypothetical protein